MNFVDKYGTPVNWDNFVTLSPEQLEIVKKTMSYWYADLYPLKKWSNDDVKKHLYFILIRMNSHPMGKDRYSGEDDRKLYNLLVKRLNLSNLNSIIPGAKQQTSTEPRDRFQENQNMNEIESPDIPKQMLNIIIDRETVGGYRAVNFIYINGGFEKAIDKFEKDLPLIYKDVVQFVDPETGKTVKGPMYDTTTQDVKGDEVYHKLNRLHPRVQQQPPSQVTDDMQYQPRDRMENPNMSEATKFRNIVKECISEIKRERNPRIRLKESLRNVVKTVLKEMATNTNEPKPNENEKTKIQKGYNKDGNERLDKDNEKLLAELETIVHGIDSKWEVYWDDHGQLIVRAQNLLYVRICPQFENNYNVDAMVKLVDRVRAIALTWDQVKAFVKANFSALKPETKADGLKQKAMDHIKDKEVIKKDAGPESQKVKVRYQDPSNPSVKDTKKDDKNYNEPQTKRDEDMPDQPMKQVTDPGKDPESKNKNIKKTDKVKPPKHKLDKKLRIPDKKTSKFTLKQVS